MNYKISDVHFSWNYLLFLNCIFQNHNILCQKLDRFWQKSIHLLSNLPSRAFSSCYMRENSLIRYAYLLIQLSLVFILVVLNVELESWDCCFSCEHIFTWSEFAKSWFEQVWKNNFVFADVSTMLSAAQSCRIFIIRFCQNYLIFSFYWITSFFLSLTLKVVNLY